MSIHVGEVGVYLRMTVNDQDSAAMDLSGCSEVVYMLRDPAGGVVQKDATYITDGSDGRLEYKVIAGDLDLAGSWAYSSRATWASGVILYSTHVSFIAYTPLEVS